MMVIDKSFSHWCLRRRQTFSDGRVTLALFGKQGQEQVEIKYQLLNPAPNFVDVVDEARSVILAGGTMSPVNIYFDDHLKQI